MSRYGLAHPAQTPWFNTWQYKTFLTLFQARPDQKVQTSLTDLKEIEVVHEAGESALESISLRLAKAFVRQKYPLSEKGEKLKYEVTAALANGDDARIQQLSKFLPTVENPRLELFQDLDIPEDQKQIVGEKLVNVQVSFGCRHQCTFCAGEPAKKVQMMPFAAVLKIAEAKRLQEAIETDETSEERIKLDLLWEKWVGVVKDKTGVDINKQPLSDEAERQIDEKLYGENINERRYDQQGRIIIHNYYHSIIALYPLKDFHDSMDNAPEHVGHLFRPYLNKEELLRGAKMGGQNLLFNYYNSDPFDYRDTTFLHEDGTPADYGDVVEALATERRPIQITTAGYPLNDKTAQRAAEKILALHSKNPKLVHEYVRLSVAVSNTMMARKGPEAQLAALKNAVKTLAPLAPILNIFGRARTDKEFFNEIIDPLIEFAREIGVNEHEQPAISRDPEKDWVMACMPGFHILPDGTVLEQVTEYGSVKLGDRPNPIGIKLY